MLGVPYAKDYDQKAVADYQAQAQKIVDELKVSGVVVALDKEIIAMIAYLHKMGRDISPANQKNKWSLKIGIMGFVGEILNGVEGIKYFYIVGLLIFIILFIVMLYRTIKIPRKDLMKFKASILENDELESNEI